MTMLPPHPQSAPYAPPAGLGGAPHGPTPLAPNPGGQPPPGPQRSTGKVIGIVVGSVVGTLVLLVAVLAVLGSTATTPAPAAPAPAAPVSVPSAPATPAAPSAPSAPSGLSLTSDQVESAISEQFGIPAGSVSCPSSLAADPGARLTCTAASGGASTDVQVTVTSVVGTHVKFDMTIRK